MSADPTTFHEQYAKIFVFMSNNFFLISISGRGRSESKV